MAGWEDFGQGKTRNELSHGWRIHKMLRVYPEPVEGERIKALKTEIVLEKIQQTTKAAVRLPLVSLIDNR